MSSSSPHGKMSHLVLVASAASMVINAMAVSAKPLNVFLTSDFASCLRSTSAQSAISEGCGAMYRSSRATCE
eukprot:CAMPEP_0182527190 /NCGR_PEP_ID=MMETSP1323-20130603/3692_1 /TAXON_ID=236787 /ORGANISM="Florenciella parvula, Strain RCC1693" /LENGTH=71 /DNA_ID=CAMNT_0024736155 /DNA_START=116 /DNA_END=331 /DNA_ORIENTATION=+